MHGCRRNGETSTIWEKTGAGRGKLACVFYIRRLVASVQSTSSGFPPASLPNDVKAGERKMWNINAGAVIDIGDRVCVGRPGQAWTGTVTEADERSGLPLIRPDGQRNRDRLIPVRLDRIHFKHP